MAYSTISKPSLHFNTKLYTGTGSTNAQTGIGFQPDFTWIKVRSNGTYGHALFDAVRGVNKPISTNSASAEGNDATSGNTSLNSFDSDGFTLGGFYNKVNQSGQTFVSWNWKAGNSAGSTNNDGSVASTVSANTTAGFSIVKFNYPSSGNFTFGHGLGVAPRMFMLKGYTGTANWQVFNEQKGNTWNTQMNYDSASSSGANWWGSTSPTSTVCTVGADLIESGQTAIAYCFAEKKGYSKFGTYTSNGDADGPFIYTGFKPAFVLIKNTNASALWMLYDNKRDIDNPNTKSLMPNATNQEDVNAENMDFLSNGFKCRGTGVKMNTGTNVFLYMAFAEEPLVANVGQGIPATAK